MRKFWYVVTADFENHSKYFGALSTMILELLKVRSHTARRNAKQRLATFANGLLRHLLEIDNPIINYFVKVK